MKALVTGAAGFIGSHLSERLLEEGWQVAGVDCLTDYYPLSLKRANLAPLQARQGFSFHELDLSAGDLAPLLDGVDYVFHEAGQPGVRASWGSYFSTYTAHNIEATQRLLEAVKLSGGIRKLVYASSSSVYGRTMDLPMREDSLPQPISPYGVTKLAAEHLCMLYHVNFGLPVVCLRYFTVYGPRQRPDMAFNKFISAILRGDPITIFGDGHQSRDFTYVADVVEANWRAATFPAVNGVFNIAGGSVSTVNEVLRLLGDMTGVQPRRVYQQRQHGDPEHTAADTSRAREALGYEPLVSKEEGLWQEVQWLQQLAPVPATA